MIQTTNNKCEVCNTIVDNFDNLVNQYFDNNYNQNDLIMKVKNPQIREILGLSKLPETIKDISFHDKNNVYEIPNTVLKNISANCNEIQKTNLTINNNNQNNNDQNNNNNLNIIKRICDVCNVETESNYKGYAIHVIQKHNPFVLEFIEDKFIKEFILKGGPTGVKICDICNANISLDINDYIVHIQKYHPNLINKSLSKYVKDRYVVSVLLGKSIYKTNQFLSFCDICKEEIDGFEEFREHMLEHKQMNNAYKGFFGVVNSDEVKKKAFNQLIKEEHMDSYNSFMSNNNNNKNSNKNINNHIYSKNNLFAQQDDDFNLKSNEMKPTSKNQHVALEEFEFNEKC
jgi:uncharacterized protein YktA (UPF0223 family)